MFLDDLSAIDTRFDLDSDGLDQVATALGLTFPAPTKTLSDAIDTATPVSLIEIFSPDLGQTLDSLIAQLETADGTLTLDNGGLGGTVTTAMGTETIDLDGTEFFDAVLAEAETLTAEAVLEDGIFSGTLTLADGSSFATDLDAGSLLESAVFSLLDQTDVVVPFSNGQFVLDIPTEVGAVTGSIDFAGGDLNLDLSTPIGDLTLDYDFPITAAFPFQVASPFGDLDGSVDLASGQVIVPLEFNGISLGAISINLEELSGEVALQDGVASLSVGLTDPTANPGFLGLPDTITTEIDLGPIASQLIDGFTEETTGSLSIASGIATAAIDGPLGLLDTTFSIVALATDAVDFLTATSGTLTVDSGNIAATLETPLGGIDTQTTVAELEDFLTSPFLA